MFDKNQLPPDAKAYFETLPLFLQETIAQSGADFHTRDDLERFNNNIQA